MNTKTLSRHYDTLKPRERWPLILSATARGDDVERDRLVRSAPRRAYSLTDYHGFADALILLQMLQAGKLLDLAGVYWESSCGVDEWERCGGAADDAATRRRYASVPPVIAYLFTVEFDAWGHFCAELKFDAAALLKLSPSGERIGKANETLRAAAFTEAEALEWCNGWADGTAGLRTVEIVVAELRTALDAHLSRWE